MTETEEKTEEKTIDVDPSLRVTAEDPAREKTPMPMKKRAAVARKY